jgi:hypothetical protein
VQAAYSSFSLGEQYWFSAVIKFDCASCGNTSAEKMAVSSPLPEVAAVRSAIESQSLSCQICDAALAQGTPVDLEVRPSTLADLKRLGLLVPRGEPLR